MTQTRQIYKCNICGNIVEVLHEGRGTLVCCGQLMQLISEKEQDEGIEKHKPVISIEGNVVVVKVGSIEHPMMGEHYIKWIEMALSNGKTFKKFLKPGDKPEANFTLTLAEASQAIARAYCNIHGLWKS